MNSMPQRIIRRREKCLKIYRSFICLLSLISILSCLIIKFGSFFTPRNLRQITLGRTAAFQLSIIDEENQDIPGNEGLYKDELYMIEETQDPAKESDAEEESAVPAPSGDYRILPLDMSSGASAGEILIKDTDSGVNIDTEALLRAPFPESLSSSGYSLLNSSKDPLVLVIHTHATESFTEKGVTTYSDSTSFRTTDKAKNMVAVGKTFSDTLNAYGITTVHCEVLHDEYDYNASYENSLETVKYYLKKYPSIKYVFDLHRDAIIRENNDLIKTEYSINGESCAQVMTLVGTNTLGADHPDWQDHMNLALKLQSYLTEEFPSFARPINTRGASFNQQYAPGSLLFEIGSCGNTLDEAKRAAVYLAQTIAKTIKEYS